MLGLASNNSGGRPGLHPFRGADYGHSNFRFGSIAAMGWVQSGATTKNLPVHPLESGEVSAWPTNGCTGTVTA